MNYSSDIIAGIALLLAGYSTWRTVLFNEKQTKLNNLLVQQAEETKANSKKADLTAAFVRGERNGYKFHIWNQGNATARNVRFLYAGEESVFIRDDVESKFPLDIEALGKDFPVKLIANVTMRKSFPVKLITTAVSMIIEDRQKHEITLIWNDDYQDDNEKAITATL